MNMITSSSGAKSKLKAHKRYLRRNNNTNMLLSSCPNISLNVDDLLKDPPEDDEELTETANEESFSYGTDEILHLSSSRLQFSQSMSAIPISPSRLAGGHESESDYSSAVPSDVSSSAVESGSDWCTSASESESERKKKNKKKKSLKHLLQNPLQSSKDGNVDKTKPELKKRSSKKKRKSKEATGKRRSKEVGKQLQKLSNLNLFDLSCSDLNDTERCLEDLSTFVKAIEQLGEDPHTVARKYADDVKGKYFG